jgi:hypothetical protein
MTGKQKNNIEYNVFSNPYTGLAAMILITARNDYDLLGDKEVARKDNVNISKTEIRNFLKSRWAEFLASCIGVDGVDWKKLIA